MSIKEAREAFKKELEMAELKQKIRDSKRSELRGQSRTKIGATYNNRGEAAVVSPSTKEAS